VFRRGVSRRTKALGYASSATQGMTTGTCRKRTVVDRGKVCLGFVGQTHRKDHHQPAAAMSTLSPSAPSPRPSRRLSTRRRAISHVPPVQTQESHDAALHAIRNVLKGRTSYDAFPVSFRLIVLDTKLNVKKALQCLLLNGILSRSLLSIFPHSHHRCSFCTVMEQRKVKVCWDAYGS